MTIKAQLAKEFGCQENEVEITATHESGQVVCELNLQGGNLHMITWAWLSKSRKRIRKHSGRIYSWWNNL